MRLKLKIPAGVPKLVPTAKAQEQLNAIYADEGLLTAAGDEPAGDESEGESLSRFEQTSDGRFLLKYGRTDPDRGRIVGHIVFSRDGSYEVVEADGTNRVVGRVTFVAVGDLA